MKLTKETLTDLIKQVIKENKKPSMILTEGDKKPKYQQILDVLEGKVDAIDTVGIMSGQNPMIKSVSKIDNAKRKAALEKRAKEMGLSYIRIGAIFGELPEQSLIILDPTQSQMDKLCREFEQWGFVWGEKAFPGTGTGNKFMIFTMQVIDYENEMGWYKDPDSKATAMIIKDVELADKETDFSFDPTSKKKFGLELYEQEIAKLKESLKKTTSSLEKRKIHHKIETLRKLRK